MRLQRVGRKHDPSYRVVVIEHTEGANSGNAVEVVGSYDARTDRKDVKVDRVQYWLSKGVQPSGTVHNILVDQGVLNDKKINVLPKRKPSEEKPEEKSNASEPVKTEDKPEETKEEASGEENPSEPVKTEDKPEETKEASEEGSVEEEKKEE